MRRTLRTTVRTRRHRSAGTPAAATAGTALAALAALTGCGSSHASASGSASGVVRVVAAENVWGDVVRQIGGPHVQVTSIIEDPNTDPHEYETDVKDAAAMSSARLVVLNGLGYDDFASKLLNASPSSSRRVLTVADVASESGSNPNPHLWYSPDAVHAAADAITGELSKSAPDSAAAFRVGEKTFLAGYQPYVDELASIKARHAGTPIAYTERVPGYLVQAAGLVLGTPASFSQSVEDGDDPSPADTAAFDRAVTTRAVKALLYNGQVTDAQTDQIKALARGAGVPVVGVTETLPPGEKDFQTWQLDQAKAVDAALGG